VFPDSDYCYTGLAQDPLCLAVTLTIALYLGSPEFAPCLGDVAATRTPVPEAAVNENGHLLSGEIEIGPAENILSMQPPPANFASNKRKLQNNFCSPVALAPNGRHNTGCRLINVLKATVLELVF
jgi:hypothetical protein